MRQVLLAGVFVLVQPVGVSSRRVRHAVGVRAPLRGRDGAAQTPARAQVRPAQEQEGQEGVERASKDGGTVTG